MKMKNKLYLCICLIIICLSQCEEFEVRALYNKETNTLHFENKKFILLSELGSAGI